MVPSPPSSFDLPSPFLLALLWPPSWCVAPVCHPRRPSSWNQATSSTWTASIPGWCCGPCRRTVRAIAGTATPGCPRRRLSSSSMSSVTSSCGWVTPSIMHTNWYCVQPVTCSPRCWVGTGRRIAARSWSYRKKRSASRWHEGYHMGSGDCTGQKHFEQILQTLKKMMHFSVPFWNPGKEFAKFAKRWNYFLLCACSPLSGE